MILILTTTPIKQNIKMATSTTFSYAYWSYHADDGNYRPYSPDISACIEQSYANNLPTFSVHGGRYVIDFRNMIQIRPSTGQLREERVFVSE